MVTQQKSCDHRVLVIQQQSISHVTRAVNLKPCKQFTGFTAISYNIYNQLQLLKAICLKDSDGYEIVILEYEVCCHRIERHLGTRA